MVASQSRFGNQQAVFVKRSDEEAQALERQLRRHLGATCRRAHEINLQNVSLRRQLKTAQDLLRAVVAGQTAQHFDHGPNCPLTAALRAARGYVATLPGGEGDPC
jgi:hypothetical protein